MPIAKLDVNSYTTVVNAVVDGNRQGSTLGYSQHISKHISNSIENRYFITAYRIEITSVNLSICRNYSDRTQASRNYYPLHLTETYLILIDFAVREFNILRAISDGNLE